jgi:membrane protein
VYEDLVTPKDALTLLKKAASAWNDDDASSMGAAIAYYTLFSIAPLLVMVIAIASIIFGREAAQGHIIGQLQGLVGPEGASAIEGLIRGASNSGGSVFAVILGTVTLMIGATTVFAELYADMNKIWRLAAPPKASGIVQLLRTRILSFGMILGIGFLLLVSLVISAALNALGDWWGSHFAGWEVVVKVANSLFSVAILMGAFAMIYKFMPRAEIKWKDVWVGAGVTALLFEIGKFLIGIYLGKANVASGFGAAGSLAILLVWIYYSAQIFLLGAEFTWVYAYRHGSRSGEAPPEPAPRRAGRPVSEADTEARHRKPATQRKRRPRVPRTQ